MANIESNYTAVDYLKDISATIWPLGMFATMVIVMVHKNYNYIGLMIAFLS